MNANGRKRLADNNNQEQVSVIAQCALPILSAADRCSTTGSNGHGGKPFQPWTRMNVMAESLRARTSARNYADFAMNANGIANGPRMAPITPQNAGLAPRDLAM
jgi:hypothetical protein